MHLFVPNRRVDYLSTRQAGLFFNVDSSVGQNGVNSNAIDIYLVQFLMRRIAERLSVTWGKQRDRLLAVKVNGICTPVTIDGIKAIQEMFKRKNPATIVDGLVAVAPDYYYGAGVYTIVVLNTTTRRKYPELWPRLQDFPDCPGPLKEKVPTLL